MLSNLLIFNNFNLQSRKLRRRSYFRPTEMKTEVVSN